MRPRLKVWIESEDGRVALSEWRVSLLLAVAKHGSLVAAARAMGVPHRTAWQRIQEMELSLGVRLLETVSGGARGGGSRLSPAAEDFVKRYEALRAGLDDLVGDRFRDGFGELSG
jgi:molybdate transport repressor ModE-like protein